MRYLFILLFFLGCSSSPKFLPYVDMSDWPLFDFKKTSFIKSYTLAFIDSDSKVCSPTWDKYKEYSLEKFKKRVDFVKSLGGDVYVAFGGRIGKKYLLESVCKSDEELFKAYEKVIKVYGIKNFDVDIEGEFLKDLKLVKRTFKILKKLQQKYNISIIITLPVMPYGFSEDAKKVIRLIDFEFSAINLMLMNYSYDFPAKKPGKMFKYSKEAIENANKFLKSIYKKEMYHKIGATAMIGENDIKNEYWYKSDFKKLIQYAKKKGLFSYSFWSLNRDRPKCKGCSLNNSTMLDKKLYGDKNFEFARMAE